MLSESELGMAPRVISAKPLQSIFFCVKLFLQGRQRSADILNRSMVSSDFAYKELDFLVIILSDL